MAHFFTVTDSYQEIYSNTDNTLSKAGTNILCYAGSLIPDSLEFAFNKRFSYSQDE